MQESRIAKGPERAGLFESISATRRSPWAGVLSVCLHIGVAGVASTVAYREVAAPAVTSRQSIRYVTLAAPPPPPPVELLEPEAVVEAPLPVPAPPPPQVLRTAPPVVVPRPVETEAAPPPPKPEPPAPKPQPTVGLFATRAGAAAVTQPPRTVEPTGFDTAPAVAARVSAGSSVTGAFDAGRDAVARPGTDKPKGTVAGTGFDQKAAPAPASAGRTIAPSGFAASAPSGRGSGPARDQTVRQSGFGEVVPAATPARPVAKAAGASTPVEILFKPTPAYTENARAQGIEGEVVLEVEFAASGEVRVLRVVRGLGHGLDESAVRAATQIRFKPAAEQGRPVDFRAHVQIVFRLT